MERVDVEEVLMSMEALLDKPTATVIATDDPEKRHFFGGSGSTLGNTASYASEYW